MRVGVIDRCLNCGDDKRPDAFPDYCDYCIGVLQQTGQLPSGLLDQTRLIADG